MNQYQRMVLRMAVRIRNQLQQQRAAPANVVLPETVWQEATKLTRQIAAAEQRGWPASARQLRSRLQGVLNRLQEQLADTVRLNADSLQPDHPPSLRQIYNELLGLSDEFPEVTFNLQEATVSVITAPIELDEIWLGPFEVALHVDKLCGAQPFEVTAQEPHPASGTDGTTHPHVQDGCLCEGEGGPAIEKALAEGRLADFFLIADRILNTYNPGSAYVPLSDWEGVCCSDCSDMVREDEVSSCHQCGVAVCYDCLVACRNCDSNLCSQCRQLCEGCEDQFCSQCLTRSDRSGEWLCSECLLQQECEENDETTDDAFAGADTISSANCAAHVAASPPEAAQTTPAGSPV